MYVIPLQLRLVQQSSGDLLYFVIDDFKENENGQELETGEVIDIEWKTFDEVKQLCKNGSMKEDRSIGILFKFFLQEGYIK